MPLCSVMRWLSEGTNNTFLKEIYMYRNLGKSRENISKENPRWIKRDKKEERFSFVIVDLFFVLNDD